MAKDLWPVELKPVETRTPVGMLREQRRYLATEPKNILEGRVDTMEYGTDFC